MSLSATAIPGKQFAATEALTIAKLNQLGTPTFTVTGSIDTTDVSAGAITSVKATSGPWFYATSAYAASGTTIDTVTYAQKYTLTFTGSSAPTSLVDGLIVAFKAASANTTGNGTTTLVVIGTESPLLKNGANLQLVPRDIRSGQMVEARYSGVGSNGQWQIISVLGQPDTAQIIPTAFDNVFAYNNVATPTTKIDIGYDWAVMATSTNAASERHIDGQFTIDATSVGTINGTEEALGAAKWHYIWIISDLITPGAFLSPSPSAPVLPSGYTYMARAGMVFYTGTAFKRFHQSNKDVWLANASANALSLVSGVTNDWQLMNSGNFTNSVPPFARSCQIVAGYGITPELDFDVAFAACNADGTVNTIAVLPNTHLGMWATRCDTAHGAAFTPFVAGNIPWSGAGMPMAAAATFRVPVRGGTWSRTAGWSSRGVQYLIGNGTSTPALYSWVSGFTL